MTRHLGYNPAKHSDTQFERRVIRLTWLLLTFVLLLVCRLFYLQIMRHDFYVDLQERNRSNLFILEPRRGTIYDRNGIVIARDIAVYHLSVERDKVTHLPETLRQLSKLLGITQKDIQIFLKDIKNHPRFALIPLINRLSNEQIAKFMLNQYRFPGVSVQTGYLRHYPFGASHAPVLGYIGRINPNELQQVDPENYSASTNIGKVGVEKYFETQLHGQVGTERIQMDSVGHKNQALNSTPAIAGNNLTLTIDSRLQQVAYDALKGERGALVAIQPSTGQVLALVSSPSYDPNLFVDGIDYKTYQALHDDPEQPLYNRAVRGTFPLGSTIKPFYALQGLDSKTITPTFSIYDPGFFTLPGVKHIYHNWTWGTKHGGQGTVNITNALEQSNDTFFFTMAMKMGITKMAEVLHTFGFGKKTQIEIPEESTGYIGTPEWKRAKKHEAWYAGDTLAAGIGQGYMTTTILQLAQAFSAIATRGNHAQITLLLQTQFPDGNIIVHQKQPLPPIQFAPADWDVVLEGLRRVITVGTGSYHFGQAEFGKPAYEAAGKTGTAQVAGLNGKQYDKNVDYRLRDNSLLEVFAPIDHAEIAVAVVVEHNGTAGLVARKVVDYYLLHILGKEKQPENNSENAEKQSSEGSDDQ